MSGPRSIARMTRSADDGVGRYGANSTVYAAMGYTTKSARSSGLTRRRDAETPKETA